VTTVEVRAYGAVRETLGARALTRDVGNDATVAAVLSALSPPLDDPHEAFDRGALLVVRNGRNVAHADGLATPVEPGDRLSLSGSPMPEG